MADKEIKQVVGTDTEDVEWEALIGASIKRTDDKDSGNVDVVKDMRRNENGKYEVLFLGRGTPTTVLTVDDEDVLYK